MEPKRTQELEDRLVDFSVSLASLVSTIPVNVTGKYLAGQLIRSGLSPSLNYGEARSAESREDFIHKMKIALKELRESSISLKILIKCRILENDKAAGVCLKECSELIAIFVRSIQTAESKKKCS